MLNKKENKVFKIVKETTKHNALDEERVYAVGKFGVATLVDYETNNRFARYTDSDFVTMYDLSINNIRAEDYIEAIKLGFSLALLGYKIEVEESVLDMRG